MSLEAREPISPPVAVLALSVLFAGRPGRMRTEIRSSGVQQQRQAALTFGLDSVHAGFLPSSILTMCIETAFKASEAKGPKAQCL